MDAFVTRITKVRDRSPSPVRKVEPIFLGILGSRNDMSMEELCEKVLHPLLETLERPPEKLLIPSEGNSNIFISDWAERMDIPVKILTSDWRRNGKRARILRDSQITQEATHLLCINGPRSVYYETMGTRLLKKKSAVFVLNFQEKELIQLESA